MFLSVNCVVSVIRLSQRLDQVNLLPGSHKTTENTENKHPSFLFTYAGFKNTWKTERLLNIIEQHISQAFKKLSLEIMKEANYKYEVWSCENILIFLPNTRTDPHTDWGVRHAFNMTVIIAVLLGGNAFMRLKTSVCQICSVSERPHCLLMDVTHKGFLCFKCP